jgi:hypothetical protein
VRMDDLSLQTEVAAEIATAVTAALCTTKRRAAS